MPAQKAPSLSSQRKLKNVLWTIVVGLALLLSACSRPLNNPYPAEVKNQAVLYSSFAGRPKHLDPAVSYSSDEYALIGQIYEPPLQYHYLKRPYTLVPLTADSMPEVVYFDARGKRLGRDAPAETIAVSEYLISIQEGIFYQPHPALARKEDGTYRYHDLKSQALSKIDTLGDFSETGTREVTAEDYIYQIKRLVHPNIHSPIAELMKHYIVGLEAFARDLDRLNAKNPVGFLDIKTLPLDGVAALDRYRY
ncbi:MAG: peptide ABC transporter substrate-binding protein, partial [Pseudomonadota bacterium]